MRSLRQGPIAVVILSSKLAFAVFFFSTQQARAQGDSKGVKLYPAIINLFDNKEILAKADEKGIVRELAHIHTPFTLQSANITDEKPTARRLADAYVRRMAGAFKLRESQVDELAGPIEKQPNFSGTELRFAQQKSIGQATVVSYVQTYWGLPVWQSGISVTVLDSPLRVTSATNSTEPNLELSKPERTDKPPTGSIDSAALARALNLGPSFESSRLQIKQARPIVYRYDPSQRTLGARGENREKPVDVPSLPLRPVPDSIRAGEYRLASDVHFSLPLASTGPMNWRAILDFNTEAVLYLRAGVAHATGAVLQADPISSTGDLNNTPAAPIKTLDSLRSVVTFSGLSPPNSGGQLLSGEFVELVDIEPPKIAPPTRMAPFDFASSVDSDDFAAASAYYHIDRCFRLLSSFGIKVGDYFPTTRFPLQIDHRGVLGEVNARTYINSDFSGPDGIRFGLAQRGTNVGIAADFRVVLHEFSHMLLETSIHDDYLGFSHSFGDSLAAILSDPENQLQGADRYKTLPWIDAFPRCHNQLVLFGWGWGGSHDDSRYDSEQILSSTMFKAYRALGGDSDDLGTRRLAAHYVCNLLIRGVALLGRVPDVGYPSVGTFEAKLIAADAGTSRIEGYPGGAANKIVRWAFEKQGLHRAAGAATISEGAPPAVDVFLDDGRNGEYMYRKGLSTDTRDIWNRRAADGMTAHETPVAGSPNFLYVRVQNRGSKTANGVTVQVYRQLSCAEGEWPADFKLHGATPIASMLSIAARDSVLAGPFEWHPDNGSNTFLAAVSATSAKNADEEEIDLSNIDLSSPLPCAKGPIPIKRLVPFDNNLALRKF